MGASRLDFCYRHGEEVKHVMSERDGKEIIRRGGMRLGLMEMELYTVYITLWFSDQFGLAQLNNQNNFNTGL